MRDPIKEAARKVRSHNLQQSQTPGKLFGEWLALLFVVAATVSWAFTEIGSSYIDHKLETVAKYRGLMTLLSDIKDFDGAMDLIAYTEYGDNAAPWVKVTTQAIVMSSPSADSKRLEPSRVGQTIRRGFHRLNGLDLYLYLGFLDNLNFENVETGLQEQEISKLSRCFESMRHYYAPVWWSENRTNESDEQLPRGFNLVMTAGFPWMMNPPCEEKSGIQLLSLRQGII